jgi:hypothetical protein
MSAIYGLLVIALFGAVGRLLLDRYERYLDAQMGPWIAAEAKTRQPRNGDSRSQR